MTGINEVAKEIHENAVAHGWWDEERGFPEVLALIRRYPKRWRNTETDTAQQKSISATAASPKVSRRSLRT